MALNDDDVREILRIIDESNLDELRIETDGLSLHLLRGGVPAGLEPEPAPAARTQPAEPSSATASVPTPDPQADGLTIAAPTIGTFYRGPGPGEAPFVEVGTRVEPATIVCIIEVMKMMNSIPAGVAGTIVEIHVENAQPIEYGTPLFRVDAG